MEEPPPPTPDPAVMIDELVEEFLLRLTPEDPALLARAVLVSKQWYRVVTGPSFRRRFREFHCSTPLLGYVFNLTNSIRFVPLSSFRPPQTHRPGVRAVSSRHGRVLLQHRSAREDLDIIFLFVWDPITGEQEDLPVVPLRLTRYRNIINWDAAVICAVGDGCNHLHCHFKVVFVGRHDKGMFSCFYSSEAGSWSDPVFASDSEESENAFVPGHFVQIGTALYTTCGARNKFFKYDLPTHQMCYISITPGPDVRLDGIGESLRLIAAEDGRLGFAKAVNSTLRLWVREENGRLEETGAIDLRTLLPVDAFRVRPLVITFADTGPGVIFLWTCAGYFTIDLKSRSCKKVAEYSLDLVVPYVSFCTPAPGAGVAISSDEVLVTDIAVSTDKGPGAGVAVSANEGPEAASICQLQGPLNQEGNE